MPSIDRTACAPRGHGELVPVTFCLVPRAGYEPAGRSWRARGCGAEEETRSGALAGEEADRLVIFPRRLIADRGIMVRVENGACDEAERVSPWASRPTLRRVREAPRCAPRACPAPSSLLVLKGAGRGARPRPQDVSAAPPTSLPELVHEPAMTKSTAVPTMGTRSTLRAALCQVNSLATSWPSIDRTSCAPRAHGDAGARRNLRPATRGPRTS